LIVVHPWTSNPLKQWPVDRYRQLIQVLVERFVVQVAVVGGPEARDQAQRLCSAGLPVANLVGRISLRQLAALLRHARLLVSNDSGPVHLAASLSAHTIVLFGSSDPSTGPRRWGPWGLGHTVICRPSMETITVEEVLAAVTRQWVALTEERRAFSA
jgi:ADP-heptose:LPS heptosyltransferase